MLQPPGPVLTEPPGRRLRIGAFELDLDARELLRSGARRGKRLTAKAQQVLLVLALRPGEVLSRDALMDAVWPDSFPTGDVLTQAIVQLRRAFDDDVDAPRYIETIARSGYRLLADVSWVPAPAAPVAAVVAPFAPMDGQPANALAGDIGAGAPPSRGQRRVVALSLLLVLGALAAVALWRPSAPREQAESTPRAPQLLTANPGDERMPVPSPDGSQFVFVGNADDRMTSSLYLQGVGSYAARRLTAPPAGARDDMPAWAADGRWLAFRRTVDARPRPLCELWKVSVVAGESQLLAPCAGLAMGLALSGDGRRLIVGGRRYEKESGLRELQLDSGEWRSLPVDGPDDEWETGPRLSADGEWLLFRRGVNTADLWRVSAAGGVPEPVTRVAADLRGHDWLGGGPGVVFAMVDERGSWIIRLDHSGAEPQRVATAGAAPRSLADGRHLLYEQSVQRYQIRQYAGTEAVGLPALASSRSDMLPALAPDGLRLAFYSDRSGQLALWLAELDTADAIPVPVEGLVPLPRFAPVWSPAGTHLLVVADGADGEGLYEIEVARRRARRVALALEHVAFALYRDEQRLLVNAREDAGYVLRVFPRQGGEVLSAAELRGVGFAQVDAAGDRLLYTREEQGGLFAASLDLDDRGRLRDDLLAPPLYRSWRVAGERLWFLRRQKENQGIGLYRLALPGLDGAAAVAVTNLGAMQDLVFDLEVGIDGGRVLVTTRESAGADIAMLDLATVPPP